MSENVFGKMAKRYDTEERVALADIISGEMKQELEGHSHHTLLDYGSGTGLVGLALSDMFDDVILADASEEMVKVAEAKIADGGLEHVRAVHLDLTRNDTDIKADVIIISLVLLHIPDVRPLLESLYKALNPGGSLIIVDFDKNHAIDHPKVHNGFAHEEMRGLMMEAGFQVPAIRTFHHGERIFMNTDASLFLATGMR
ncbi:class I SAM-dependent methyltransferase [Salinicoccus roseus]|uniref:class I SAM-dependent DNA methyltransferase n=1 Tax=Salinicoccus roseus TaxID=45670 RepID=UPI001CA699AB|nr:class I SAM-dependent methyltransferase [Salinicoccus roseus]MBY8908999.1 class I SAM-dependent methyltransferase [Salinicoccus roseus]